jgi:3-oxoadipate CoA-transferase alpha subunit
MVSIALAASSSRSCRRERIRAAGAGIGAFFSPTGVGTELAADKEERTIDGRRYVLEYPIRADVALISAYRGDRWGNLVYRETARNFGPVMASAAVTTVVQVDEIVELGSLDPESVVTPGIFVDRVVAVTPRRWIENGSFVGGVDIDGEPLAVTS